MSGNCTTRGFCDIDTSILKPKYIVALKFTGFHVAAIHGRTRSIITSIFWVGFKNTSVHVATDLHRGGVLFYIRSGPYIPCSVQSPSASFLRIVFWMYGEFTTSFFLV